GLAAALALRPSPPDTHGEGRVMPRFERIATYLAGCALVASASRAVAQAPADTAPPCAQVCPAQRQSLDDAWWTGPMIAPSPGALSPGHFLIEPYFYDVRAGRANSYGTLTYLLYGVVDGLTMGASPPAGFNTSGGAPSSSGVGLGDVSGIVQKRLTKFH